MRWTVGTGKSAPTKSRSNNPRPLASIARRRRGDMADSINTLRISITKRYGGKTVLDRFPLEIRGREFVTFLGPSGCGKSTALGIIAGLVPATQAAIRHDAQLIDNAVAEKAGSGLLF